MIKKDYGGALQPIGQITVGTLRKTVGQFVQDGLQIGSTEKYMRELVEDCNMDQDGLETVLAVRRDYGASVPAMAKFLRQGVEPNALMCVYAARDYVVRTSDTAVSLGMIIKVSETFVDAEPDEDVLPELLQMAVDAAGRDGAEGRWAYPDQVLKALVRYAKRHGIQYFETALDHYKKRNFRRNRIPDEEHPAFQ
jgi:hypothetical protein